MLKPRISIIIPTLNEEENIESLLMALSTIDDLEIIVSDGGSTDRTTEICSSYSVQLLHSNAGRGYQLNAGASCATGDILLFLHADSQIEPRIFDDLRTAFARGNRWGCCTLAFNEKSLFFLMLAFVSNARSKILSSCYGDQGIFCQKDFFWASGSFPSIPFLEDIGFSHRLRRHEKAVVIPGKIITSTRRFREDGMIVAIIKMQFVKFLFLLGVPADILIRWYIHPREKL